MPPTTRSQMKKLEEKSPTKNKITIEKSLKNENINKKTVASCSTNKNMLPPCADGFYMKLNRKKEECCYKDRKSSDNNKSANKNEPSKLDTDNTKDILEKIREQSQDIKDVILSQMSPKSVSLAMLSNLTKNEGYLANKGEEDIMQFFLDWLRGGDILAYYYIEAEASNLCEMLCKKKLAVSPNEQINHIIKHLKLKYKHLRGGRFHRLTKLEKEHANKFWEKLSKDPQAQANITLFKTFKTAIQDGIDHFFYQKSSHFVYFCKNKLNKFNS